MKIVYGVNGQGFGHAMRSKVVLDYLVKAGHTVKVVCFKQSFEYLKNYFDCYEIDGWELVYLKNQVSYLHTAIKDAKKSPQVFKSFRELKKLFEEFKPQMVFTDYEPLVSLMAKLKKLPCLSIGNHHLISRTKISFPVKYWRDYWAVKIINRGWTPYANNYVLTTFFEVKIKNKNTYIFPPILQNDILNLKPQVGSFSVVYLTSEYPEILEVLKILPGKFIVYGLNRDEQLGNVILKKFSRPGLLEDLRNCRAVIANAGFTFITEALYLGKPYFALPIARQFEQLINAFYIKKLGYGDYSEKLEALKIQDFFRNLEVYRSNLFSYSRQDNHLLFEKIEELMKKSVT
jgi:uncharacterized protein (TIGR00661 family)